MRLDTDPYLGRYASRVKGMSASEIRALFAVASRPEIVSFAGGMPYTAALDMNAIEEVAARVIRDHGAVALQYGGGQGREELRAGLVEVMRAEGVPGHVDDLVVTVGGQQALELVAKCFVDPGDVVIAEGPTYVGGIGALASHQADVRHLTMDGSGMQVDLLPELLAAVAAEGKRVKYVYVIPNHQNPAGVSLSLERRHRLVELAEEHDLLDFEGTVNPSLRSMAPERVVYIGTMSKTFAPGARIGWIAAPRPVREKLVLLREAADLCPSNLTQMIVETWLATTPWQEQVKRFREVYAERATTMLDALGRQMPRGVRWTRPTGGFYVWLTLPPGLDTSDLLAKAIQHRVAYVPGRGFYADGTGGSQLRLCYSFPPPERIVEGVERLGELVEQELELVHAVYGDTVPQVDQARGGTGVAERGG
jgi:2-aminoadipate transaminase